MHSDDRTWATTIECVSSREILLNLMIIFQDKSILKTWTNTWSASVYAWSKNEWIDNEHDLTWLKKIFDSQISHVKERRLLLIDDHASHITVKFIEYCWTHQIILLCLSSHTTHYLQSLNVECFESLSVTYKRQLDRMNQMRVVHVNKADFLEFLRNARRKTMTLRVIQFVWASTDLVSYNSERVHLKLSRILREFISSSFKCSSNFIDTSSNEEKMMRLLDSLNSYSLNYRQKLRRVKRTACLWLTNRSLLKNTSRLLFKANLTKKETKRKRKKKRVKAIFENEFDRVLTEKKARKLREKKMQRQKEMRKRKKEKKTKKSEIETSLAVGSGLGQLFRLNPACRDPTGRKWNLYSILRWRISRLAEYS